jgi:hypothetical protein
VLTNVNDGTVQDDGTITSVFTVSEEESQRAVPDCVVGVVDIAEVGVEHTLSEHTEADTRVPTKMEAPNLEVLGTTTAGQRHLVWSLACCHLDGLWQTGVS